jgi:hypothetical protein
MALFPVGCPSTASATVAIIATSKKQLAAIRAAAAGMSGEQIRDLYEAELDGRGLEVPMGEMLDADVDAIAGNYVTRVRLFGRSVVGFAKLVNFVTREHPR